MTEEDVTGVVSSDSVRQEDEDVGQEDKDPVDDVGMVVLSDVSDESCEELR